MNREEREGKCMFQNMHVKRKRVHEGPQDEDTPHGVD